MTSPGTIGNYRCRGDPDNQPGSLGDRGKCALSVRRHLRQGSLPYSGQAYAQQPCMLGQPSHLHHPSAGKVQRNSSG